jgi:hypothetical protein
MNGSNQVFRGVTKSLWSNGGIIHILRDERYTGVFIGGKVEMGALGTGKRIRKPKEDWIIIPDALPAIITRETWDTAVANRVKTDGQHGKPDTGRILYQRVRCGYCGHVMKYNTDAKGSRYQCFTPRFTNEYGCMSGKFQEAKLVHVVKTVVQSQVALLLDMEKLCRNGAKDVKQSAESRQAAASRLDGEIGQLQTLKRNLYERYKNNALDRAAYLQEREAVETDIAAKTAERDTLFTQSDVQTGAINSAQRFFGSFAEYQAMTEPTAEMVNALVETVKVYGEDRIEVIFSFKDELKQAIKTLRHLSAG